jgi:UDP-N-acetylmuramate dehydrogenase
VDNDTCEDVLKLISHIQKVIKDKFDVDLELEIQIKGE